MSPDALTSLFSLESLLSLQGSAAAALLVPNVLIYLVGDRMVPYAKWISFALSIALAYLVAYLATDAPDTRWVLAFFNGFLIFASAVGMNEAGARMSSRSVAADVARRRPPVSWL